MANLRHLDPDELLLRPGTYYHPQTEILVVVDDSPQIDADAFDEGDDGWVLIGDEVPIDDHARDELIQSFTVRHAGGPTGAFEGDDEPDDETPLEPDEE